MDYCSSCRRHLNGALVCPGCGAHAPVMAPAVRRGRVAPAPAPAAAPGPSYDDGLHDGPADIHGEGLAGDGLADDAPQGGTSGDLAATPAASDGRAARRRQRARWKKGKRRALVASAVALVGGGLTVASLDRQSTDRAQAASVPDDASMGGTGDEAAEHSLASSTPPVDPHRSTPNRSAGPDANDTADRQSTPAPRTTPLTAQPDAAAAARAATAPAVRQAPATTSSAEETVDDTGEPAAQETSPSPAATDPNTSSGTSSGTSQTSPAPAATSPSEICLLVLCVS